MQILGIVISWILSLLCLIVTIAMFGMGGKLQGILFLGVTLCLMPPFRQFLSG